MPRLRNSDPNEIIAILVADIHASHTPPIARSVEGDWYDVMSRQFSELSDLQAIHSVPIVCAGDVLDKWSVPAELINFLVEEMPTMLAIPGQHDLMYHSYDDLTKSSFATLIHTGTLKSLVSKYWMDHSDFEEGLVQSGLAIRGFPWGSRLDSKIIWNGKTAVRLGVAHQYVWAENACYHDAPQDAHVSTVIIKTKINAYDAVVFGDNHKGFTKRVGGVWVHNNGTFFRRKSDEAGYKPCVGLLKADCSIERYELRSCKNDKFRDDTKEIKMLEAAEEKISALLSEIKNSKEEDFEFLDVVQQVFRKLDVKKTVRNYILRLIGN